MAAYETRVQVWLSKYSKIPSPCIKAIPCCARIDDPQYLHLGLSHVVEAQYSSLFFEITHERYEVSI